MSYIYRVIFACAESNERECSRLFTSKKKADKCAAGMTGGWQHFIRIEKIEKPTTTKGWVELANKL